MPCKIAHSIDLFLDQDITTAIIVPNPTPGAKYTGWLYPSLGLLVVQDANSIIRIKSVGKYFFIIIMRLRLLNLQRTSGYLLITVSIIFICCNTSCGFTSSSLPYTIAS